MLAIPHLRNWFRRPLSCEDVNRFIIDYLEGTLPPRTRRRFEAHLGDCPACHPYFDQYLRTVDLLREEAAAPPEPPEELVELTLSFLRDHLDDVGSR